MCASVYIASVTPLLEDGVLERALDAASPQRRAKARRYLRRSDQALSLGAEMLLRRALRDRGLGDRSLVYRYGEHRKPYLPDAEGFHFNLSHSGEFVMCAASAREVGCDIEAIADIDLEIARRYFFRDEYEHIAGQPDQKSREDLFFRYWALKESFMKCTGLGMSLPLDEFQIVLGRDGGVGVDQHVDVRDYRFAEIDAVSGYRCAICQEEEEPDPHVEELDIVSQLE